MRRGWSSTSETLVSATFEETARSTASASSHAGSPAACRSELAAAARRTVVASDAERSAPGPPCRIVSAADTTTTRSVSTSARWMRASVSSESETGTRSSAAASWTSTRPRYSRASGGGSNRSRSRWPSFRARPPATRMVWRSSVTPSAVSSVEHRRERLLPRVDLRSRNRERRRLDHDGDAGPSPGEVGQGRAGEWKAKRIANGSGDVDGVRGRRRSEDDVLVVDRDVDDPRAREQRNTAHSWSQPSTCETSRRCRRINSIECRRR